MNSLPLAVMCRYTVNRCGLPDAALSYIYFIARDIDMALDRDGHPHITTCDAIEVIAVV